MEQETGEGQEMQRCQGRCQPFIVAGKPAETGGPGEVTLHYPAAREEHEAALGLGQLDDRPVDPMRSGCCSRLLPGLALVHIGQLHVLTGDRLHRAGQFLDLRALLLVARWPG
jgi:hypothetical protein